MYTGANPWNQALTDAPQIYTCGKQKHCDKAVSTLTALEYQNVVYGAGNRTETRADRTARKGKLYEQQSPPVNTGSAYINPYNNYGTS